ncbi:hypothetical protein B5181_26210 [Streptomyces sp. 4F]|nr:hypothetical protein B5181_26210 [Streptomyces sp. 4F]
MVGRPRLRHPGGMSAEVIGCRERRVHRLFHGRSTSLAPALAAIIIVDAGPAPQTAPPERTSRASRRVYRRAPCVRAASPQPPAGLLRTDPARHFERPDLHTVSAGQGT